MWETRQPLINIDKAFFILPYPQIVGLFLGQPWITMLFPNQRAESLRSHMGWLMDSDGTKIRQDKRNATDLSFGIPRCQAAS